MAVSNYSHNLDTFNKLRPGDRIEFKRGIYSHWGLYIGEGKVVHLAGENDDGINAQVKPEHLFTICGKTFNKARVTVDDFWDIVLEDKACINNSRDKKCSPLEVAEIIANATAKIGEEGYSLLYGNCEHFVNWCRYGVSKSEQVDTFLTGVATGIASLVTIAVTYALLRSNKAEEKDKEKKQTQTM
ncbi:phospholipase A and acyltransferase 3-like [Physella acuta]|uniref:phospholipase A and acyltransferase 3-like n=1 Tax=Physella acuta TaxID=109671 RepID=UPI0027DE025B|nr:phospholipase A and acyltransferase 3-like [Physella acuta]